MSVQRPVKRALPRAVLEVRGNPSPGVFGAEGLDAQLDVEIETVPKREIEAFVNRSLATPRCNCCHGFFATAMKATGTGPLFHTVEQYANTAVEADHGQLKGRLRPMRALTGPVYSSRLRRQCLVQNLRDDYELGGEDPANRRLARGFAELALAI